MAFYLILKATCQYWFDGYLPVPFPSMSTKEKRPPQAGDKYIVRFPEGMRDEIAAAAKANNRSMNAEIIARLSGGVAASEPGDIMTLMYQLAAAAAKKGLVLDIRVSHKVLEDGTLESEDI